MATEKEIIAGLRAQKAIKTKNAKQKCKLIFCLLQITGCLQSNSSSCDDTQAVIVILDVNDNAPVFEEDPYKVTISTDVQSQTELVTIKASDADLGKNGQVRYELLLDGKGNFNIDEFTGELHYIGEVGELKVNRRFQLKVKATDNGIPPLSSETTVTINVGGENTNPNAPEFTNVRLYKNFEMILKNESKFSVPIRGYSPS